MNLIKRTFAGAFICLLLYGCGFFAAAGKKVSKYCPGLNLRIDGVNLRSTEALNVTAIEYEESYQAKVDNYVSDKSNGFAADNPRKYQYLSHDNDREVADGDSILVKHVGKVNGGTDVIYNATTRKIIIVEPKF